MSEEYAFTLKLDHKTIEEVLRSVFRNTPLEKSVSQLHQELFFKKNDNKEPISIYGLTKSLQDSVIMLPRIAHYSRSVDFGQQEVEVLGPYGLLDPENTRYSVDPFNPFFFVSTEKEKEELSERISQQGEQFLERQHQLWITPWPSHLVIYQNNSYEGKKRKQLFGKKYDLLIKPEIYGLVTCEFPGIGGGIGGYVFESEKGIIDFFLNGFLSYMKKSDHDPKKELKLSSVQLKRNSWSILTCGESFPRTAESFILEKGFKKDTSCEDKISEV